MSQQRSAYKKHTQAQCRYLFTNPDCIAKEHGASCVLLTHDYCKYKTTDVLTIIPSDSRANGDMGNSCPRKSWMLRCLPNNLNLSRSMH